MGVREPADLHQERVRWGLYSQKPKGGLGAKRTWGSLGYADFGDDEVRREGRKDGA